MISKLDNVLFGKMLLYEYLTDANSLANANRLNESRYFYGRTSRRICYQNII